MWLGFEQCWRRDYRNQKERKLFAHFSPLVLFPILSAGVPMLGRSGHRECVFGSCGTAK